RAGGRDLAVGNRPVAVQRGRRLGQGREDRECGRESGRQHCSCYPIHTVAALEPPTYPLRLLPASDAISHAGRVLTMTAPLFKGVITALITPLRDGKVDEVAFDRLLEHQIAAGVDGVVPMGTTGENASLTVPENL